jgi:hypothetical protein
MKRHIPHTIYNILRKRHRLAFASLLLMVVLAPLAVYLSKQANVASAADSLFGFDEGYGSTVSDSSGSSSGTITGAAWKTDDLCRSEKCLYFDGASWINFGDENSYDFSYSDTFTIQFWFRHAPATSAQVIMQKYEGTGADGGFRVQMESDGDISFGVDNDNSGFPTDSVTSTAADYDDNRWHHVSAVRNGATGMYLYIDGNLVASNTSLNVNSGTLANDDTFYIGDSDGTDNGDEFVGFLDEVKIYTSTARSADEVKADLAGATPDRGTSASFGPDTSYLSEGLVGYWNMDESLTVRRQYASNTGDPASATFTNTPLEGSLLVAIAMDRSGTTEANFTITGTGWVKRVGRDTLLTDSNARRTLVIWTKVAGSSEPSNIEIDNGTANNKALLIQEFVPSGGTWTFEDKADNDTGTGSTSPLSSGTTGSVGAGNLILITAGIWRNQTDSPTSISWTNSVADTVELATGTNGFTINTGYVDDLTAGTKESEVSWTGTGHEASAAILVFSNSNTIDTEINDSSGNQNTLINNSDTSSVSGKFGNGSEHVPASTQYFSVGSTINNVKTVSFWANPDSTTNYFFSLTSGTYLTSSSGTLTATGFTDPKIYVNGVESTTIAADAWQLITVTDTTAINADQLYIGRQGSNYYDGTIDEVRLYNLALTPSEVSALYSWAPGPVGSLEDWMKIQVASALRFKWERQYRNRPREIG